MLCFSEWRIGGEFAFPKLHVRPWWILSDDPLAAPNVGDGGGGGVGGDGEMLFAVEARGARSEEEEEVIASSCGVQISSRSLKCS